MMLLKRELRASQVSRLKADPSRSLYERRPLRAQLWPRGAERKAIGDQWDGD